ncbi:hypothetical protein [Levilactobacillus wangkuiensis]|uniref:hypothetical protein n=1 Tax=Levilactobacillus wangkuiensis TaxID=2799566 RepID=UPI0019446C1C|nr:hypothetical protein [Levilactobacillus wangkuiensis]
MFKSVRFWVLVLFAFKLKAAFTEPAFQYDWFFNLLIGSLALLALIRMMMTYKNPPINFLKWWVKG